MTELVREMIGVSEENGLVAHYRKYKMAKYISIGKGDSIVCMTIEGEVDGRAKQQRRKTGWIDNIKDWN